MRRLDRSQGDAHVELQVARLSSLVLNKDPSTELGFQRSRNCVKCLRIKIVFRAINKIQKKFVSTRTLFVYVIIICSIRVCGNT